MKTCGKCQEEKDLTQFSWRNKAKGKLNVWCKACFKVYDATRFRPPTSKRRAQNKAWQKAIAKENHKLILRYLAEHPCVSCGERHPASLEFDHLRDKKCHISQMLYSYKWQNILKEIDKCQVLCSNCHRKKTAKDRGFYTVTHPLVEELFPGL